MPAFVRADISAPFGGKKYLLGNMPAYDVLQLSNNEGVDTKIPMRLLFAGMLAAVGFSLIWY